MLDTVLNPKGSKMHKKIQGGGKATFLEDFGKPSQRRKYFFFQEELIEEGHSACEHMET